MPSAGGVASKFGTQPGVPGRKLETEGTASGGQPRWGLKHLQGVGGARGWRMQVHSGLGGRVASGVVGGPVGGCTEIDRR